MKAVRRDICVLISGACLLAAGLAEAAETRVCVVVDLHKPTEQVGPPRRPAKEAGEAVQSSDHEDSPGKPEKERSVLLTQRHSSMDLSLIPLGQGPVEHLKRLIEHFITHEEGFIAVSKGCKQRVHVELFPLRRGWTVFIRYSGHGREEQVE